MKKSILTNVCLAAVFGCSALVCAQSARLTVSGTPNPNTGGTVTATSTASSATCGGNTCQVDPGSSVILGVAINSGFRFGGWSGGTGCTGTTTKFTITPTSNVSCTANIIRVVGVHGAANPTAGGTISASLRSGVGTCSGDTCSVDIGSNVTLSSTTNKGYRFTQWSGLEAGCNNTANSLSITATNTSVRCVANFVQRFIVSGTVTGAPSGTVVKATSPSIAPQANCSGSSCTVDLNVNVTLTAPVVRGFQIKAWIGTGCTEPVNDGNPNTLSLGKISANLTCTAFYQP